MRSDGGDVHSCSERHHRVAEIEDRLHVVARLLGVGVLKRCQLRFVEASLPAAVEQVRVERGVGVDPILIAHDRARQPDRDPVGDLIGRTKRAVDGLDAAITNHVAVGPTRIGKPSTASERNEQRCSDPEPIDSQIGLCPQERDHPDEADPIRASVVDGRGKTLGEPGGVDRRVVRVVPVDAHRGDGGRNLDEERRPALNRQTCGIPPHGRGVRGGRCAKGTADLDEVEARGGRSREREQQ